MPAAPPLAPPTGMEQGGPERQRSLDLLKLGMAVMVVGIHANPVEPLGPVAVILTSDALFRVAVPVFFIMNGYFFDRVARTGGTVGYVKRLIWLYVLWTALYLPGWIGMFDRLDPPPDPWLVLRTLGMGYWQLWYLPGLALGAAVAALMIRAPLPWLLAAMAICFLGGVGIVYGLAFDVLQPSVTYFGDMTVLHRNGLLTGFPFVAAGMLIHRHALQDRLGLPLLAGLLAATLGLLLAEGAVLATLAPKKVNNDNLLMLALACPLIVLVALKFTARTGSRTFGTYASGIFYLHAGFCIFGYRVGMDRFWIFCLALAGATLLTWVILRAGLARRLF